MTRTEESVLDECKPYTLKEFEFVHKTAKGMLCSIVKDRSVLYSCTLVLYLEVFLLLMTKLIFPIAKNY